MAKKKIKFEDYFEVEKGLEKNKSIERRNILLHCGICKSVGKPNNKFQVNGDGFLVCIECGESEGLTLHDAQELVNGLP
jgi:hypothetical protein